MMSSDGRKGWICAAGLDDYMLAPAAVAVRHRHGGPADTGANIEDITLAPRGRPLERPGHIEVQHGELTHFVQVNLLNEVRPAATRFAPRRRAPNVAAWTQLFQRHA